MAAKAGTFLGKQAVGTLQIESDFGKVKALQEETAEALRIDGREYDEAKLAELIELYRRVLGGAVENPENLPGTTRGHYFRGVM